MVLDLPVTKKTPYSYQLKHLKIFAENSVSRLPLFWQMRTGKSPTVLWWLLSQKPVPNRVLIVCPKSVLVSWKEELEDFEIPYLILTTKDKDIHEGLANFTVPHPKKELQLQLPWCLTNYECLTAQNVNLHAQPWEAVILDEATKIMNPKTRISKLITNPISFPLRTPRYLYDSPYIPLEKPQLRACLAGKPNPESDLNFFQQFKFLYGGMGKIKNYWEFRKKFFYTSVQNPGRYLPRPGTQKAIAKYLSKNAFVLTRRTLGTDLPNVYEKRFVSLSVSDRRIYDEFEKSWFSEFLNTLLKEGLGGKTPVQLETKFAAVASAHLHQMACGFPKHPALSADIFQGRHKLVELLSILREDLYDEKVVIWCRYLNDIDEIVGEITRLYGSDKLPTLPVRLQGGMTTAQVEQSLKRFRSDYNYMVCQVNKAAMGMDLSAADTQIFFSRSWSHLVNDQAKDRLIHPGKKRSILTLDLITEETIDEDLYHALIEKQANSAVFKWFLERTKFQFNFSQLKEKIENVSNS